MLLKELYSLTETESAYVNANAKHGLSADDIMDKIGDIFAELEKKYKKHETTATTIPSAPNTSTFKAARGGMISYERNVDTYSHYGNASRWNKFLKIGGGVDSDVRARIKSDFQQELAKLTDRTPGTESTVIYCTDAKVIIGITSGTNWGGIGAYPHNLESKWRPEAV